jgi:hypothetical protein
MVDTCALGQCMPDLPQGQPLLFQLVRSLDDRLFLRISLKVDTIRVSCQPYGAPTICSCVAFMWARLSLIPSLMTRRSS